MREINHNELLKLIPQRYPFLMVDTVKIVEEGRVAEGRKMVSGNEGFFQGHFPGKPIMPGVLIVEAMGQTAAALLSSTVPGKLGMFVGLDEVRFKRPVVPGDILELNIIIEWIKHGIGKATGIAMVAGKVVTTATLKFALVDADKV